MAIIVFLSFLSSCTVTETRTLYDSFPAVKVVAVSEALPREMAEAEEASKRDPDDPAPHYFLGKGYLMLGQLALAEKEFTTLTRLSPQSAGPYYELARICAATGRDNLALSHLLSAIKLAPDFAEAYYAAAKVCERLGDLISAARYHAKYSELKKKK